MWDFVNNDSSVYDGNVSDTDIDAHGTHVADTIGARGGNGAGVAGVNWNVTLISGKFLGPVDGTISYAIEAVNYFIDLKTRHNLNIMRRVTRGAVAGTPLRCIRRSSSCKAGHPVRCSGGEQFDK